MNAAVSIETRPLKNFPVIIQEHMNHLPGWGLVIFGSDQNEDFLNSNITNFIHHKVKFSAGFGQFEYNLTLTNPKFWESLLDYERVVIIQHDSMLLKNGIEDFLEFDYVGAPWKFQHHGGNGGLSIRNPKIMLAICKAEEWIQSHGNEDVFFCNRLKKFRGKLAPRDICAQFSVESIFKLGTLGYHAIDAHLSPEQCELIRNQYKKNLVPNSEIIN